MFWDSPLSSFGIEQAKKLNSWLEANAPTNKHAALLTGQVACDTPESVVVFTSNLRRAISTSLISLAQRLKRHSYESVVVTSALQEITRNIDGYPLSTSSQPPIISWMEATDPHLAHVAE